MKEFWYFAQLCLYALGAIGGIGWTLYVRAYPIAAGVLALALMALPYIKGVVNKLIGK